MIAAYLSMIVCGEWLVCVHKWFTTIVIHD